MEKVTGEGKVVCVTGASGYIASWLVKLLLQRGYTVKASVRDLSDVKRTDHLVSLDGAKERLKLFKANLLEEGSFDSVVDGCDCVFHTASPVAFTVKDPKAELIEPALNGTLNVLRSCLRVPCLKRVVLTSSMAVVDGCDCVFHTASPVAFTVKDPKAELIEPALNGTLNVLRSCLRVPCLKRVVLTSSMAAVLYTGTTITPDMIVGENLFSDPVYCQNSELWYVLAKTLAEEAAWKFAKENGIDLVSINPGYVIGPLLQPTLNFSVEMILNLINEGRFPNILHYCVDVRDTVMAHIHAFEMASANGRHCLVGHNMHISHTANILRQLYPTFTIANECESYPLEEGGQISKEKALTLGVKFMPLEVSLRDTVESLKEKGFLKPYN